MIGFVAYAVLAAVAGMAWLFGFCMCAAGGDQDSPGMSFFGLMCNYAGIGLGYMAYIGFTTQVVWK